MGTAGCGRADVNRDGSVNPLDETSILQSAPFGTSVTCGAVYATDFSCGSTRRYTLNPVFYRNDDGTLATRGAPTLDMAFNEQVLHDKIEQQERTVLFQSHRIPRLEQLVRDVLEHKK